MPINEPKGTPSTAPQTIELDCPPGATRPGDLIKWVINETGLTEKLPANMFFGNWTWDYSEIPSEEWARIRPTLKHRITMLYNAGSIRYGSW